MLQEKRAEFLAAMNQILHGASVHFEAEVEGQAFEVNAVTRQHVDV